MAKPDLKGLTKQERKDYLKDVLKKEEQVSKTKGLVVKIVIALSALLLAGFVVYIYTKPPAPKPELGQAVVEQGRNHINPGSAHPPYNSNPPTSGPHWPEPAKCQVYTEEIPDEAAIHSLEHGAVWVTYKNKDDKDLADKLTKIVSENSSKVILSPRSKNDSKIAVVSWRRILKLETFDEKQISAFIKNYKNSAPEPLASC